MEDSGKKSLNYPSYFDTKYENFIKPILSTSSTKTLTDKVLLTSSTKTSTQNLEDLLDNLYLDKVVTIKNDEVVTIKNDDVVTIKNDEVVTIKNDEVVTIKNDEVVTIKNDYGQESSDDCKHNLEDLFAKLYLDEVVTIKNDYGQESDDYGQESDDYDQNRVFYNFFEIGQGCDPAEIKKLSPWDDNGPILKTLPTFNEMEYFIKKKKCICLLLNCENSVVTKNMDIYCFEITPWNFLCSYHKKIVSEKYEYESDKNI